jgi:hypothetical protein
MRVSALSVLAFLALAPSVPTAACGCIETSPSAKNWTKCSAQVAATARQSKFYENYLIARRDNLRLLPQTPARFAVLEKKIVKTCGRYQDARQRDLKAGWEKMHVPDDFVEARWH